MPHINQEKIVPHTASEMYALVDDIKAYPLFLPWCEKTEEHFRDEDSAKASITINAAGMSKTFSTHNLLQKNKMIEIRLLDGPFSHLEGFWRFDANDEGGCKVSFDLEFEFSNKIIGMVAGPFFYQATSTMLEAFCSRAEKMTQNAC
jgi:ribosome-associated toxin RatA of RatAB toxin-antitoxin module